MAITVDLILGIYSHGSAMMQKWHDKSYIIKSILTTFIIK